MLEQPLLRRFIIIRSYNEDSVHTGFFRLLGKENRGFRTVGTCSGDNGNPARRLFNTIADHIQMLLMGQRGSLACGAAYDDGIGASGDLRLNMFPEFFIIHASVLMKRGDNCYSCSFKNCHMLLLIFNAFPRCLLRQQSCLMKCINKSLPAAASGNCHAVPLSSVPLPAYFPMVKKILRPSNYVKIRRQPEIIFSL